MVCGPSTGVITSTNAIAIIGSKSSAPIPILTGWESSMTVSAGAVILIMKTEDVAKPIVSTKNAADDLTGIFQSSLLKVKIGYQVSHYSRYSADRSSTGWQEHQGIPNRLRM